MSRRLAALVALVVVIAAGLVVHGVLPDSDATDIAGDALYTVAVYAGVALVLPWVGPWPTGALAVGWSVAVELFQATGIPLALAAVFPPIALVLGTGFDARDLVVYVLAGATATLVDATVTRIGRRRPPADLPGAG